MLLRRRDEFVLGIAVARCSRFHAVEATGGIRLGHCSGAVVAFYAIGVTGKAVLYAARRILLGAESDPSRWVGFCGGNPVRQKVRLAASIPPRVVRRRPADEVILLSVV